jgi:hypothetical protein
MSTIKNKMITVKILNQNGDSETQETLEGAIQRTIEEYFQRGRFPYVNSSFFTFSAESANDAVALLQDTLKLRKLLEEEGEVVVTLTGDLRGGN